MSLLAYTCNVCKGNLSGDDFFNVVCDCGHKWCCNACAEKEGYTELECNHECRSYDESKCDRCEVIFSICNNCKEDK